MNQNNPQYIEHDGKVLTFREWAEALGWDSGTLRVYYRTHGTLPGPKQPKFHSMARDGSWEADKEAQRLVEESGPMSLEAIGDYMGLTKERIRQIQNAGLRKIRRQNPQLAAELEARESVREERLARCGSRWSVAV